MEEQIRNLVTTLPDTPGVYQFFDSKGTILYVGKAKNLKRRVTSYFVKNHESRKTAILVRKIDDIRHIVVETEADALLLENNLIKKYRPRYNVLLKDDKTYPWICVKNEKFPRIFSTRNARNQNDKYYGPYTSLRMLRTIIELIKQLYKIRTCNYALSEENIAKKKFRECLEFHIGNCKAPCVARQTKAEYDENIQLIHKILSGNIHSVIQFMNETMQKYAAVYRFEDAQEMKGKIELLKTYQSKSTIVSPDITNVDVFTITNDEDFAYVNFLKVVNGSIIQVITIEIQKKVEEEAEELLPSAILEIRNRVFSNSSEVIIPFEIEYSLKGVKFVVPQKGDKKKLLELSERNVHYYREQKQRERELVDPERHATRILETIKKDLHLQELPTHIECFDNSNTFGSNPVASCVVFRNAKPATKDYRHFNIKTVIGINDFASMEEIILRRYTRLVNEEQALPQLIVVDGGKGQLSAAVSSLEKLNLRGKITIIGIAKRLEEIYFPDDEVPLYLDKNSETLKVIQHIRNEAHRFGITFHKNKRDKSLVKSELEEIKGVGEQTIQTVLTELKSVKKIREASLEDLSTIVGSAKARLIYDYFHQ